MITAAIILSGLLQFADLATTVWILHHGGVEKNPVMRWMMAQLGAVEALFAKAAFVLIVLVLAWHFGIFHRVPVASYVIAAIYIAVIVHNLAVIARMRRRS